jgi:6-phosphogluconolactonase
MRWVKTDNATASSDLANRLNAELIQRKTVLWLISGGSNIQAAANILAAIQPELTANLLIMPVDERYGEPGHPDSNWYQFITAAGDTKQAQLYPVLMPGRTLEQTANFYEDIAAAAFRRADVSIALLGVGTDGHIAGILPNSPAAHEEEKLVSAYVSDPYERLTLTFPALSQVTGIYAFAFGETKFEALTQLQEQLHSIIEQPVQFLKPLQDAYLYNDLKGETS